MSVNTIIEYPKGAMIIMANTINPGYVYILKSGEISIESVVRFTSKGLNHYLPGDTFGYVSAITKNPHSSTLIAVTDCTVIRLSLEAFFDYLKKHKSVFLKILSYNAEKLRVFIEYIDPFVKDSEINKDYPEKLIQNAKTYFQLGQKELAYFSMKKYIEGNFLLEKKAESLEEAKNFLIKENPDYTFPEYPYYSDETTFSLKKGDVIFVEDESEDEFFYLVIQGSVKISKLLDGREFILGILGRGEFFGEMAILHQRARNATAVAFDDCIIQRLTADSILEKVDEQLLVNIFQIITRRLWYAFHRVYMLKVSDPNVKLYIQLQMLVADELAKIGSGKIKDKFVFRFTLNELQRMVNIENIDKEKINEFLSDPNLSFSGELVTVYDRFVLEEKVDAVKKRHSRILKEIII